jgi:hypothetical protein
MREKNLEVAAKTGIVRADQVVFAASSVRDEVIRELGIRLSRKMITRPQGSYKQIVHAPEEGGRLRDRMSIPRDAFLVLGVG